VVGCPHGQETKQRTVLGVRPPRGLRQRFPDHDDEVARPPALAGRRGRGDHRHGLGLFFLGSEGGDMKGRPGRRAGRNAAPGGAPGGARSTEILRVLPTTDEREHDPALLRLSYVCRADDLLRGRAGRSAVLARIHRLFDASPDARPDSDALDGLARLIDGARRAAREPLSTEDGRCGPETHSPSGITPSPCP